MPPAIIGCKLRLPGSRILDDPLSLMRNTPLRVPASSFHRFRASFSCPAHQLLQFHSALAPTLLLRACL